jgi:DedD protein
MEPLYKQRLVGAVVLVTFAVVVVPLFLGEPRTARLKTLQVAAEAPPPPVFPEAAAPVMSHAVSAATTEAAAPMVLTPPDTAVAGPASTRAGSAAEVTGKAQSAARLASAWVIQAGSFSSHDNAARLVTELRKKGLPAWLVKPSAPGGHFRVLVGPQIDRDEADAVAERLKREFKLAGQVQAHVPTEAAALPAGAGTPDRPE